MRLFLGLIGGFVLLIALLIGGLWQRGGRKSAAPFETVAAPQEADEPAVAAPVEEEKRSRPRAGLERRPRVVIEEVAVLRGEVIGGADGQGEPVGGDDVDEEGDDTTLLVEADDGSETFAARVTGRRFVLRLPPRRYTLTARDGDQVGRLEGVVAVSGVNGELVIRLEPASAIAGIVRGRGEEDLRNMRGRALRRGGSLEESHALVHKDRTFTFEGLMAGARYDLVFSDLTGGDITLTNVLAPSSDVVLELPVLPTLHGAVGTSGARRAAAKWLPSPGADTIWTSRWRPTADFKRRCREDRSWLSRCPVPALITRRPSVCRRTAIPTSSV